MFTSGQAVQKVEIAGARVANACRTLDTITILAADAQPTGQKLVELGDWK
jgi:hypothetical protein